ncbi:MAG TPA: outer membrane lipoprotein carrier protein LolA [Steroidobacteraceae bacterium]
MRQLPRAAATLALSLATGLTAAASASDTAPATALDRYLQGLHSLSATFTQTVTDSHGARVETGSGQLLVQRPGKFHWDYEPTSAGTGKGAEAGARSDAGKAQPRGQILVADGRNLWFYDRELSQVTVKPVAAALSSTPIVLLSGSDADLRASFEISDSGTRDGLDWVEVKPRSTEADFSVADLGFDGGRLVRMIINDRLGQTVRLDFTRSERNARIDPAALEFQPPAGVDVIGTPQS